MKLRLKFSFPAVLAFMICTDREGTALFCLTACVLHEMGHLVIMLLEGKPPSEIILYGGGIHIHGGSKSLLCASGGCIVNILLFLIFYFILPEGDKPRLFGVINLIMAAVNLLPVKELDGRLILEGAFIAFLPPHKALRVVDTAEKITVLFSLPAVIMLVFSGYMSFSAIIFFFYLLAVDIFDKM